MDKICVIGSGISGLSSASTLTEAGYKVDIVASDFPPDTTSNKAAAFWFPYHVRNLEKGLEWSRKSYDVYNQLSLLKATGISKKQLIKVVKDPGEEDLSWMQFLPAGSYTKLAQEKVPPGFILGYEITVPLIETQIFLPWLIQQLKQKGVQFIRQSVEELNDYTAAYDCVVNCTGLGSRKLCNDERLYPIRGQVALVEPDESLPIFLHNTQPFYIVPRKDATIIGGTFEENESEITTEPETLRRLHQQAIAIFPQLKKTTIKGSWAGLRPFRDVIRVEREANRHIIHNYGHGGSGFTVAWGCAEEVLSLVNALK